jgi:hypothetical protein
MAIVRSRGNRAVRWIEQFCLVPSGPDRGQHARLSITQRDIIRQIYDTPTEAMPVSGPLAAYLALYHVCGPAALDSGSQPRFDVDIFTTWNATGPDLKGVLRRDREHIVCPELGTRWPTAAL